MENKQKVMYVILGGSTENMTLRANKVLALHQYQRGTIIVAGLPSEVTWMTEYCKMWKAYVYPGKGSWDTLSNVTRDILPNLKVLAKGGDTIKIIAPTGKMHGQRTIKAWKLFAKEYHKIATFQCPDSGEADGDFEKKLRFLYSLGKPGILLLYWIARVIRK